MEIVVFILGGCHSHISPFHIQCNRPFPDWGYLCPWVCFSFSYTTLPALSCPPVICFCCTRHSTFSPLWTWSKWHGSIRCKRSQTCSQSTVLTLFSKNSYGCNICIPFLWFESRNLQCFLHFFSDLGHENARLRFDLWVSCMATCVSPSDNRPTLEGWLSNCCIYVAWQTLITLLL